MRCIELLQVAFDGRRCSSLLSHRNKDFSIRTERVAGLEVLKGQSGGLAITASHFVDNGYSASIIALAHEKLWGFVDAEAYEA